MLRGIDVSHYQGAVDWASLKSRYDIAWGAAKATEAEASYMKDSQFAANWRGMKNAGLVRMAYNFAHPDNDPTDDATSFLAYVKASGGIEPEDIMVCDMEANQAGLPMLAVRDWLAGWADIVTKATGRKPFLYTGSGFIANNATKDLRSHFAAWWFPRYPSAYDGGTGWPDSISGYPTQNNWGSPPDIWQFSQTFAGHNMDANITTMTLADLKTRGTKPGGDIVPPPTTPEDDMPYTPAEIEQYAGIGVHGQKLGRSDVTIGAAIETTMKDASAARALLASMTVQVSGLTAAVKALSEKQGVDPAAIVGAVQTATEQALADLKITLAVDNTPGN
jgi:GH25 family lysozyme M1 (1,4-beta-N-acetylmuramidase)